MTIETTMERATVARRYLMVSGIFAVLGAAALSLNALQLVWPDIGSGISFLTFGRIRPIALNAIVFGWLGIGLLGVAFVIVPKLAGAKVWRPELASAALAILALSLLAGIVAVAVGESEGSMLFELPWWADVGVGAGLGLAAISLIRTASSGEPSVAPALWFSLAGAIWLTLGFVSGAVPGLKGVNASLQNAFGITAVVTPGILGIALGSAYYVAGQLRGMHHGTRVAHLGFWSFAFVGAWTAPRLLVLGPAANWLETVAVVFSFILLVPVTAILADLAATLRGTTKRRLLIAGGLFLAAYAVLNLISSFRSPSSITRFTGWDEALLLLPLLGAAGCWLLAFVTQGSGWTREGAALSIGVGIAALASLTGGLTQGISWVGGVNSGSPVSTGEFFALGSTAWYAITAIGVVVASLGVIGFAARAFGAVEAPQTLNLEFVVDDEDVELAEPIAAGMLTRGVVALFSLAAISVFLIPTLDLPNRTPTLASDATQFADGSLAALGRDLYVSEGCMYCHSQEVRPVITDVGLGAVSEPGDYARQSPVLSGYARIGPDLTHIGSRTDSTRLLLERLRAPRSSFDGGDSDGWAIMPAYDYLDDAELLALAEYLGALK